VLKFNFVGQSGSQLIWGSFALLYGLLGVNKLVTAALAVEVAVLHNFVWHEKFTWKDQAREPRGTSVCGSCAFHAGNGLVSLVGNVALIKLLSDGLRMNAYVANAVAIAACALANFASASGTCSAVSGRSNRSVAVR